MTATIGVDTMLGEHEINCTSGVSSVDSDTDHGHVDDILSLLYVTDADDLDGDDDYDDEDEEEEEEDDLLPDDDDDLDADDDPGDDLD